MRGSRDERKGKISRRKEGKGFGGEQVSLRCPFEVGGYRRWMIANECLNGKNLLIMAWYNAWFDSLVSPTFSPFTIPLLTSDMIFRDFYPLAYTSVRFNVVGMLYDLQLCWKKYRIAPAMLYLLFFRGSIINGEFCAIGIIALPFDKVLYIIVFQYVTPKN